MNIIFITALLVSLAVTTVQGNDEIPASASDLESAWNMGVKGLEFFSESSSFKLTFNTTGSFKTNIHLNEEFYDAKCKTGNSAEHVIPDGIISPSVDSNGHYSRPHAEQIENGDIELAFEIQPEILSGDANLYTPFSNGTAKLVLCVRTSIGFNGTGDPDDETVGIDLTLEEQINSGFTEVNFIESLITVNYDLTNDFSVTNFNVEETEMVINTAVAEAYGVATWLCNVSAPESEFGTHPFTPPGATTITRKYPPAITNPSVFFKQGSLISVCVRPVNEAYAEGIVMDQISDFTWERSNGTPLPVLQIAVVNGQPADNMLSYAPSCDNADYCRLSSMLIADFYISGGTATGFGSAKTKFADSRRRLGSSARDNNPRLLQTRSSMAVKVHLTASDDGPIALKKTHGAGVASIGFAVNVASLTILVCSLLL